MKLCKCMGKAAEPLSKPSVSEKQHNAMGAAAGGNSTLGIPKSVGADFVHADKKAGKKFGKSETGIGQFSRAIPIFSELSKGEYNQTDKRAASQVEHQQDDAKGATDAERLPLGKKPEDMPTDSVGNDFEESSSPIGGVHASADRSNEEKPEMSADVKDPTPGIDWKKSEGGSMYGMVGEHRYRIAKSGDNFLVYHNGNRVSTMSKAEDALAKANEHYGRRAVIENAFYKSMSRKAEPSPLDETKPEVSAPILKDEPAGVPNKSGPVTAESGGVPNKVPPKSAGVVGTPKLLGKDEVAGVPNKNGPVSKEVAGVPQKSGAVVKEVAGVPQKNGPTQAAVAEVPQKSGAVVKEVAGMANKNGPVAKEVAGVPQKSGAGKANGNPKPSIPANGKSMPGNEQGGGKAMAAGDEPARKGEKDMGHQDQSGGKLEDGDEQGGGEEVSSNEPVRKEEEKGHQDQPGGKLEDGSEQSESGEKSAPSSEPVRKAGAYLSPSAGRGAGYGPGKFPPKPAAPAPSQPPVKKALGIAPKPAAPAPAAPTGSAKIGAVAKQPIKPMAAKPGLGLKAPGQTAPKPAAPQMMNAKRAGGVGAPMGKSELGNCVLCSKAEHAGSCN
jgi:hypothetical protein